MKHLATTLRAHLAKDQHFSELLSKGLIAFLLRLTGALLVFVMQVILARILGAYEFGLFALALTISMVLASVARFGMDVGIVKMVAKSVAMENHAMATGWLIGASLTVLYLSIGISLVMLLGAFSASASIFGDANLAAPLKTFALGIPVIALMLLFAEAHKGLKNMVTSAIVQSIVAPALVIGVAFGEMVHSATGVASAYIAGCAVSLAVGAYSWHTSHGWHHGSKAAPSEILAFGWPFFLANLGTMVLTWADTLIVSMFVSMEHVGIYFAASKLALLTSFILIAVNAIAAPKFTALYATNDVAGLQRLARQSTTLMVLLAASPTLLLIAIPGFWLGLFGDHFNSGSQALVVLTLGQAINVACGSVGLLLAMTGHEKTMRNILLTTGLLTVLLGAALARHFGINGMAYATAIGTAIWNIWMLFEVRNKLGFWTLPTLSLTLPANYNRNDK